MLKRVLVISSAVLAAATVVAAQAQTQKVSLSEVGLMINGPAPEVITLANKQKKTIRLMSIALSPAVASVLSHRVATVLHHPYVVGMDATPNLPASKYDGMNGEAVLDQGQWGTCATFSTTAAVNALLSLSGDSMVSQLCNLEVGRTLGNGEDGGWQGSFGSVVLGQLSQYGYVNMQYQDTTGCGGLTAYPAYSTDSGSAMALADFTAHSAMTFTGSDWTPIIAFNGNFSPIDPAAAQTALTGVKQALNQGYRVVFGTIIDPNVGQVGAAGTYKKIDSDTWVMTSQIPGDLNNPDMQMEGHEIIIDGYDDNACATYTDTNTDGKSVSKKQCGLLRIRNSWSDSAGDQGDYYMSYDYFKGMVIEAYAIGTDVKDKFKPNGNN